MRTSLRIASAIAAAVLLASLPAPAGAATKKITIKPTSLSPFTTQQPENRTGSYISGANVCSWAMLKLPVGAKITGLTYRRIGLSSAATNVGVFRVQPGKAPAWQGIYQGVDTTVTPPPSTGTIVTVPFVGPTKKVQAGWSHFVMAWNNSGNTAIGEITVKYETP